MGTDGIREWVGIVGGRWSRRTWLVMGYDGGDECCGVVAFVVALRVKDVAGWVALLSVCFWG